ncbi:hypothetical protein BDF19DRAFT_414300 [Syncephalis fuscata]|nr:hypothetical protein BDF19DRAFT_414300 [Syncephalis fuscata]
MELLLRLKSTGNSTRQNRRAVCEELDNINTSDNSIKNNGYIERRRQGNKWYNYEKFRSSGLERRSSFGKVKSHLLSSSVGGIGQAVNRRSEFDGIGDSSMNASEYQPEVNQNDEELEVFMLRDALVNNNLDSAWSLFNTIKDKGLLHKHRVQMALTSEQGRVTSRININDYLHSLFETMRKANAQFSRPRDYAFWMLWILQYPKFKSKLQLVSGRVSAAKMALGIYFKARDQELEDDARLMIAVSLSVWYLSHEKYSNDIWLKRMAIASKDLTKAKVDLHPTAYTQLLANDTEWMTALLIEPIQKDNQLALIFKVYDLMRQDGFYPQSNTWTTLVLKCIQYSQFESAIRLWNDRREAGLPCSFRAGHICAHSSRGYAIWPAHLVIIPILLREQRLPEVDSILNVWSLERKKRQREVDDSSLSLEEMFPAIVDSSVDEMNEPLELANCYALLIDAYAQNNQLAEAERVYTQLLQRMEPKYAAIKTNHWKMTYAKH